MWLFLGIVLSAAWLGAVYLWFEREFGLENLAFLLPGEIGQFLAGVAAPLALIWIIFGLLHVGARQGRLRREIADLRSALEAPPPVHHENPADPREAPRAEPRVGTPIASPPVTEAEVTPPEPPVSAPAPETREGSTGNVTSLAEEVARNMGRMETGASEGEAELDPEFRQQVQRTGRDLNAICMDLSAVLCRKPARDEALKSYNRGHKDAFHVLVRDYLSRHEPSEIMARLAQADAQSLLHTYAVKFAGLLDEAQRRDASGVQETALRRSAMGLLYEEIQRHTEQARG